VTQTWLSLSIRCSGPDPERDRLTALAGVRFAAGAELATFTAEIAARPDRPGGRRRLIRDLSSPSWVMDLDDALRALAELLPGATVVGLGAPATLELLWRQGLAARPAAVDSLDLAALVLPA
jgi:hypothetical protein